MSLSGGFAAGAALAQGEPVQPPATTLESPVAALAFPGIPAVPSAVAGPGGARFAAVTYATPRGGIAGQDGDGDVALGFTLGNPLTGVGATVGLAITGLDPFGDAGSLSVSLSRIVDVSGNGITFVGGSIGNIANWGPGNSDLTYSLYASRVFGYVRGDVEIPMQVTFGVATDNTLASDGSGRLSDGAFFGFGVGLTPTVSAGFSATRTQVNVGVDKVLGDTGASVALGVLDVTDNTDRQQVRLSVSLSF